MPSRVRKLWCWNLSGRPRLASVLFGWVIVALLAPPTLGFQAEATDPEQAYLNGLRDRKLYRLSELYCRQQLERSDVSPSEHARYTIELANILAVRAQEQTVASTRAELWQQASELLRGFLKENPQHVQAATLEFQLGVYELAQGEILRQQAKIAPQNAELVANAKSRLNAAAEALRRVDEQVNATLKKRAPGDLPSDGQPTYKQLLGLSSNSRFRLGQALLGLAHLSPKHSADQTEFASRAKVQFEAFTQRYSPNELTLESYLGRAECLRLLNDHAEVVRTLRELEKQGTPEKYLDRALVVRAQLQLDQKNPAAARDFMEDARKLLKTPNPELDLLHVQATLEVAREQTQGQGNLVARRLVSSAIEEMDRIAKTHGPYWLTRCELLLAELAAENVLVEDPTVLVRMADGQYRRGDQRGTVLTLDRAVKLARERGEADLAIDLGFRAASILVHLGEVEQAAARFAEIAATFSNHARAPQAHFMVAHCFAQIYAADPKAARLTKYEQVLEQHLRTFAADETAAEVRWLLGSLRLSQQRWKEAIELFRGIPAQHRRHSAARQEIRKSYDAWLSKLWERGETSDMVAAQAIEFLKQNLPLDRQRELRSDDVPLMLTLARILTHPGTAQYEQAETLLEQVLFGKVASDAERAEARRLSIVVLLEQDKFPVAARMLDTEFLGVPQELFAVVQVLEEAAARSSEMRRRQIGRLQLGATERLVKEAERLTPEQSLQAEILLALAYTNAGEAHRAEQVFAKLRDRVPGSPRVLEAQAECMMQLGRYAQARELYRQLLGTVRENSPEWFKTKYNLALAIFHTGDIEQCLKIIQITALLHPELGGPEWKAKFEELRTKCQAK